MYKRIFTFGCSYTNYGWPTWADIIIKEFEEQGIPGYNFGIPGLGNVGIYHVMLQAHIKYKFTEDDLILVLWSTYNREDRLKDGVWRAGGGVFNNEFYDRKFLKKYWDLSNDLVKNYSAIISANLLIPKLKNMSVETFEYFNVNATITDNILYSDLGKKIINFYKDSLPPLLKLDDIDRGDIYTHLNDGHPSVLTYLDVTDKIASHNNFSISEKTKIYYKNLHNDILKITKVHRIPHQQDNVYFHNMENIFTDE
jgi:hypothetical protein